MTYLSIRIVLGLLTLMALVIVPLTAGEERVLYEFRSGADGGNPQTALIIDDDGNLYGTTSSGGSGPCTDYNGNVVGCGTVFKLSPPSKPGDPWRKTLLYSFPEGCSCPNGGADPVALVWDKTGNLYGATGLLGAGHDGNIYQLTRPERPDGTWTYRLLYSFTGDRDASHPTGLALDKAVNLYGTS